MAKLIPGAVMPKTDAIGAFIRYETAMGFGMAPGLLWKENGELRFQPHGETDVLSVERDEVELAFRFWTNKSLGDGEFHEPLPPPEFRLH